MPKFTIVNEEVVERNLPDGSPTKIHIVDFRHWKESGRFQFLNYEPEFREKNIKEAQEELKKAIKNNFKDFVVDIEITQEDLDEAQAKIDAENASKPKNTESTP